MAILFQKNFKKKLEKLPPKIQEQFFRRLKIFVQDKYYPTLNNHSVDKAFPQSRSINVTGDYRAIFKEEYADIIFITIGTHSELYR